MFFPSHLWVHSITTPDPFPLKPLFKPPLINLRPEHVLPWLGQYQKDLNSYPRLSSLTIAFSIYDKYNFTANREAQQTVTNVLVPALADLTPNGAAYLNEADFNEPNWQETFYGSNYPRLLSIKRKYDPQGILWGKTSVGSEGWDIAADGRLCRL